MTGIGVYADGGVGVYVDGVGIVFEGEVGVEFVLLELFLVLFVLLVELVEFVLFDLFVGLGRLSATMSGWFHKTPPGSTTDTGTSRFTATWATAPIVSSPSHTKAIKLRIR